MDVFVQDMGGAAWQGGGMQPLSRLPPPARARLRRLVAGDALLSLYLDVAEAEAARGDDPSRVLLGRGGQGLALGAQFDELAVFSTLGELAGEELDALAHWPGAVELHLTDAHHARLAPGWPGPIRRLVAMAAPSGGAGPEPGVALLDPTDFADAATVMARHNPDSLLSARMAGLPLAVWRDEGRVLAMGGTIGLAGEAALLGHFLTVPEARGRGLARRIARHLRWHFAGCGVRRLVLATTEDNAPACRAYAAAGFKVLARRWQLERG